MSYIRYLCLFTYNGVQHILCCGFILFFLSCVPYATSCSGLSIFDTKRGKQNSQIEEDQTAQKPEEKRQQTNSDLQNIHIQLKIK